MAVAPVGQKGRALFDFEGDSSQNELSFKADDEVMVYRKVQ